MQQQNMWQFPVYQPIITQTYGMQPQITQQTAGNTAAGGQTGGQPGGQTGVPMGGQTNGQTASGAQQTQQQPTFAVPPKVITTKDYLYLKDGMSWLLDAMKKCSHFAGECTDPVIRQALDRAGQMHQRHYQMLLRHLQNNNAAEMARVQ